MERLTEERLARYLDVTKRALDLAKRHFATDRAAEVWDMADRYYRDALDFKRIGREMDAFAAVNYAHGWLDAGARLGHFSVKDSSLFTVDDD